MPEMSGVRKSVPRLLGAAWALALLAVLGACATTSPPDYDYDSEPDPRTGEYVIGEEDRLRVTVWRNDDLSTSVTVRPDGTVTLPLMGDVQAAGRTAGELREDITKRLASFVTDESAIVTVAVTDVNSYRFTVAGAVTQPGVFTQGHYVTVVEAVAMAGGFTRFAKPRAMQLTRVTRDGATRRIPIDYEAVSSGRQPEANLVMTRGDVLFVP